MADLSISVDINATGTKRGAAEAKSELAGIRNEAGRLNGVDLRALNQKLKAAGEHIKSVGQSMQAAGTQATLALTAPLTALGALGIRSALELDKARTKLTALVGSTDAANRKIAELRALADSSVGVTRAAAIETFSQLKGIGGVAEESINRMIVAMGKLNAAFNIDDQAGFMRNMTQLFSQGFERQDIKEALGRVPFFEQLLESAFGTSDPEKLNALKAAGTLTMDTFMSGLAEAIQKDQRVANIGENLTTKLAKGFERMNDALAPLGQIILDTVVPVVERLGPIIDQLGKWFAGLSPHVQMAIVAFGAMLAAIGPVLIVLGAVVTAIGSLVSAAVPLGIALLAIVGAAIQMGPVLAIVGAQAYVLYQAWTTNFAGIRDLTFEVAAAVQNAWNVALTEISAFTQSLLAQINEFWLKHGDEIKEALAIIEAVIKEKLEAIRAFWNEHGGQITEIIKTIWETIKTTVTLGLDIVLQVIRAVAALIRGDWQSFWDATARIIGDIIVIWVNLLNGAISLVGQAVKAIFLGVFALKAWVDAEAYAIGVALVQGMVRGVLSLQFYLIDKAAGLIKSAVSAMKSAAQIESPSKVTEEIGGYIAEGLAVGMDSGAGEVAKSAHDLSGLINGIFGGDINGFLRNAFDVLTDGSRSWGDRLKTIFGGIVKNFRDMVSNMASNWLSSIFGSGNGQGGSQGVGIPGIRPGGTGPFNPGDNGGSGTPFGGFRIPGDRTGTIDADGNFVVDGRSNWKKITGKGGFFGDAGFGNNVGTYGAIGGVASMVGGAIGGRVGGFISGAGAGLGIGAQIGSMIMPGIGTAVGAAIGALAGGLMSLFGGDPKRKRDKKEKLPALNKGFTDALKELRDLVGDVRTLRVSPDSAIARATELRNQIASGFGLEFESKKYRKQAQTLIRQRTQEADALIAELRNAAEIANAAGERHRRLIPEFATGVFMSRDFTKQLGDFKRMNGMMPGRYSGIDTINARIGAGEMVLNPRQQQNVRSNAGLDPFRNAGIPGYAGGGVVGGQAASASAEPIVINLYPETKVDAEGMVQHQIKYSSNVEREIQLKVESLAANDRLSLKRRGL